MSGAADMDDASKNSSSVVSLVQQLKAGKMSKEELFDQLSRSVVPSLPKKYRNIAGPEAEIIWMQFMGPWIQIGLVCAPYLDMQSMFTRMISLFGHELHAKYACR